MKKWDQILQYFLIALLCLLVFAFLFNRFQRRNLVQNVDGTEQPKVTNDQSAAEVEQAPLNTIALIADRLCLKNSLCDAKRSLESKQECADQLKANLEFINYVALAKFGSMDEFAAALQSQNFKNDIDRLAKCQKFIETSPCPISLTPLSNLRDCDKIFLFDHF